MRNLVTDLDGILVGNAEDKRVASGVSVVVFEEPAVASIAIHWLESFTASTFLAEGHGYCVLTLPTGAAGLWLRDKGACH